MQINYTTLEDIFTQNCGFYIPNFQREFSWTKDPALKMVEDINDSIKIKISEPNSHNFFLGSLILLRQNPALEVVIDNHSVANTIYTVIDGQQRLTTLAILAAVLQDSVVSAITDLKNLPSGNSLIDRIIDDLESRENKLKHWQSFNVGSHRAEPKEKPLIIRSLDAAQLRAVDQWTLNGDPNEFYRSDIAVFLQSRINEMSVREICSTLLRSNSKVREVAEAFVGHFSNPRTQFLSSAESPRNTRSTIERLEVIHDEEDYWATNEPYITALNTQEHKKFFQAIYLLLFCDVLMDRTLVVTLKPEDAALAYDMFQSINGTGVPLTTIEVIKPDLVQKFVGAYAVQAQPKVSAIEDYLARIAPDPEKKATKTAELICDIARAYEGNTELTKIFSAQRGFLKRVIDDSNNTECLEFLDYIKHDLAYRVYFIRTNGSVEQMRGHLLNLNVPFEDADLVSLIMVYINEANHMYAHRVLSVFYSRLACQDPLTEVASHARIEFVNAAKSCAAFFTLWTGLGQSRFPDATYKSLFTGVENITFKGGKHNQTSAFLNRVFLAALNQISITSTLGPFTRENWVESFIVNPIYSKKKAVTKFSLLLAHHDSQPDFEPGNGGLLVDGPRHCAPYLTTDGWFRSANSQIEHIAVQNPESDPEFIHFIDKDIYDRDPNAIHRIGNLTFLSGRENPAIGRAPWPVKIFFYWSLTNRGTGGTVTKEELMAALGILTPPPSTRELSESADFVHHLAPLVQYGLENQAWTLAAIQRRGRNIANRVFTALERWLQ